MVDFSDPFFQHEMRMLNLLEPNKEKVGNWAWVCDECEELVPNELVDEETETHIGCGCRVRVQDLPDGFVA